MKACTDNQKVFLKTYVAIVCTVISFGIFAELPIKGSLDTSLNTNSLTNSTDDYSLSQDFSLTLYRMFDKNRLLFESSVTKDWRGEQEWTINDPTIAFSHPVYDNEFQSISLSESALIGVSKEARKNTTLLTSLRFGANFTLKDKAFDFTGFKMVYAPTLRKSIHRQETTRSGRSNFEWTLAHKLSANYEFSEIYYVGATISYQRSWTYSQNHRDRIDHAQMIGMSFNESTYGEIGHSYGASPLTPSGKDYRVNFYDPRFSTVYISIGYSF